MNKHNKSKFSFNYQLKTFRWAANGLSEFYRSEIKAILHTLAAAIAILAGIVLKIEIHQWLWVALAIALVFLQN